MDGVLLVCVENLLNSTTKAFKKLFDEEQEKIENFKAFYKNHKTHKITMESFDDGASIRYTARISKNNMKKIIKICNEDLKKLKEEAAENEKVARADIARAKGELKCK